MTPLLPILTVLVALLFNGVPAFGLEAAADQPRYDQAFKQGTQLFQTKKFSEALKFYQSAAATSAEQGEAQIMVGYCYYSQRKYKQALEQYQGAAKNGKLISVRNKAQ